MDGLGGCEGGCDGVVGFIGTPPKSHQGLSMGWRIGNNIALDFS